MRAKTMTTIAIILLILAAVLLIASIGVASFTMTGKRQTYEEAMAWQSERYDTSFYDTLEKTDYTVESYDGYVLHVQFLKNPAPTDKYIIISHGYTDCMIGSLKYAGMYLDYGYNCIIYDLRGHGANERTFTSYGIREGQDLAELIKDTRSRYADIRILALQGESLGSATTISSLKYKPEIDFAVADCGFSDIENVLRGGLRAAHVPQLVFELGNIGAKLRYGYSLKSMRPIDALADNTVPILFMHGAADNFILPKNSQDMYDATKGVREIHLIEGAPHAESILTDPQSYRKYVAEFLEKVE